jgi:phosphoglycolate phosphatase-like HAD superfamily hydrolase
MQARHAPFVLFLFDIDGTILLSGGAGLRALELAFQDLHGMPGAMDGIPPDGKTDPFIVQEIFQHRLGRAPSRQETETLLRTYTGHLQREVGDSRQFRVMPGVAPALDLLEDRGATIGLATGNIEDGARIKLEHCRLWERFAFGGYASDAAERSEVVACAIRRGERHAGRTFAQKEIFVIGDTPRDVAAAHACGAVALGVATGPHPIANLVAAGADAVFATLEEFPAWLAGLIP